MGWNVWWMGWLCVVYQYVLHTITESVLEYLPCIHAMNAYVYIISVRVLYNTALCVGVRRRTRNQVQRRRCVAQRKDGLRGLRARACVPSRAHA